MDANYENKKKYKIKIRKLILIIIPFCLIACNFIFFYWSKIIYFREKYKPVVDDDLYFNVGILILMENKVNFNQIKAYFKTYRANLIFYSELIVSLDKSSFYSKFVTIFFFIFKAKLY